MIDVYRRSLNHPMIGVVLDIVDILLGYSDFSTFGLCLGLSFLVTTNSFKINEFQT